jgi:hypothetical protein
MKIVAFSERRSQPAVVERILKHCGLWDDTAARGPPAAAPTQDQLTLELEYVDTDEFVTPLTLRCCPSGQPVSRCSALAAL